MKQRSLYIITAITTNAQHVGLNRKTIRVRAFSLDNAIEKACQKAAVQGIIGVKKVTEASR